LVAAIKLLMSGAICYGLLSRRLIMTKMPFEPNQKVITSKKHGNKSINGQASKESPAFFLRVTNLSDQKQLVKIDESAAQTLSPEEKQPFEMLPRFLKCVPLSLYPVENDVTYRYEIGTFDGPSKKIGHSNSLEVKILGTPSIAVLRK